MRVFLIALVIALLPLRGWVGDAMAVSMAASAMPTASAAETPCPHAATGGQPHHVADAPVAAPAHDHAGSDTAAPAHDASHHGHLVCDVCNGPALHTPVAVVPAGHFSHGVHIERAERFASLAPRHAHKPPIA